MLNYPEIAQLSDRDLDFELTSSRNSLFRQQMGVRTGHLKDSHLIRQLKRYVAQLLTESKRRQVSGEKVERTSAEVVKKAKEAHSVLEKAQEKKVTKEAKVSNVSKGKSAEETEEKVKERSTKEVKVKKVEKKGWFGRKKKTEKFYEKNS
ncbi:MAG: 50S ribosomal protein L29 [Patescibacteria group bacterium]